MLSLNLDTNMKLSNASFLNFIIIHVILNTVDFILKIVLISIYRIYNVVLLFRLFLNRQ